MFITARTKTILRNVRENGGSNQEWTIQRDTGNIGQSRDTGNIGHKTQTKAKQSKKHNKAKKKSNTDLARVNSF